MQKGAFDIQKSISWGYVFLLSLVTFLSVLNSGCKEGDVQDPNGVYAVQIIFGPASDVDATTTASTRGTAKSGSGTATLTRSGDLFSVFVDTDILRIGFNGNIIANDLSTTVVDSTGSTVDIHLTFGDKRKDFAGTISFTSGTYTLTAHKFE